MPEISFAWWNLENLFPADNHPNWKGWNEQLLDEKLANLASVIRSMGNGKGPDLLGVCEVADEPTLTLLRDGHLADLGYEIAYHESRDLRGIDVGFLYRKKLFKLHKKHTRAHTVDKRIPTRDIFEIYLEVKSNGAVLNVLGNHWTARSEGKYESEPYRLMSGELCSTIVEELLLRNPDQHILVMGDFNDEPHDRSIQQHLLAIRDYDRVVSRRVRAPYLYNLMWSLMDDSHPGTFYFSKEGTPWFMFDQVMVSRALLKGGSLEVDVGSVQIYRPDAFTDDGKPKPFRKKGEKVVKGYSDHFPVVGRILVD